MLFAVWCLGDLERVEDLEARMKATQRASMLPFTETGAKNLNEERRAVLRDVHRRPVGEKRPDVDIKKFLDFPGMPNYRGQIS